MQETGVNPGSGRPPGEGHGCPLQRSCLEYPVDRGAWRATVRGVARSPTRRRPGPGRCGQGLTGFWEEKGTANHLIREPNFRVMSLSAHLRWQSRKEISEEKDPQRSRVSPWCCGSVLRLGTQKPGVNSEHHYSRAVWPWARDTDSPWVLHLQNGLDENNHRRAKTCKMLKIVSTTWWLIHR